MEPVSYYDSMIKRRFALAISVLLAMGGASSCSAASHDGLAASPAPSESVLADFPDDQRDLAAVMYVQENVPELEEVSFDNVVAMLKAECVPITSARERNLSRREFFTESKLRSQAHGLSTDSMAVVLSFAVNASCPENMDYFDSVLEAD